MLNRLYAVDSSLKTLWNKLPPELRADASAWSDAYAERPIVHNRKIKPAFDPDNAPGWEAWRGRQRTGKPYEHWGGPLLAGLFYPDFFTGLRMGARPAHLPRRPGANRAPPTSSWRPSAMEVETRQCCLNRGEATSARSTRSTSPAKTCWGNLVG